MKFVCNNCGFSAEVPDRRTTCPMCASDNVSVASVTEQIVQPEKIVKKSQEKASLTSSNVSDSKPKENAGNEKSKDRGPTEKITLNDDFFQSKPDREQQEIANILKELYPETTKKEKSPMKLPDIKIIIGGTAIFLIIIASAAFAFSAKSKNLKEAAAEKEEQNNLEKNEVAPEVEEEIIEDEDVKPIYTPAPAIKKEPEKPIEEPEKLVERPDEKPLQREELQKRPEKVVEKQAKRPVVKTIKKTEDPKPSVDVKSTFDSYVQSGHKALAEKRFTDALHEYKNASRLIPSNGPVYKFIGIAYAYLQNQEQACINYRKYIQNSPNAPDKEQVAAFLKACP